MDIFHYSFIYYILAAAFFVSIICGIMGTLVVVNRMVFVAGGIAHAAYGGVGLAFLIGAPVIPTTMLFTVGISLIIAWLTYRNSYFMDVVVGLVWAAGMSLGIILIDLSPGYNIDLMSYLFGNLLSVSRNVVIYLGIFSLFVMCFLAMEYKKLWLMSYDLEYAKARGIKVEFLYFFFVVLVGVCVVLLIQLVGLLLVIALFSIPPYLSERFASSFGKMMVLSIIFAFLFCYAGIFISFAFNLSSGASIIMVGVIFTFFIQAVRKIAIRD